VKLLLVRLFSERTKQERQKDRIYENRLKSCVMARITHERKAEEEQELDNRLW